MLLEAMVSKRRDIFLGSNLGLIALAILPR
jgi:hypothetical protein